MSPDASRFAIAPIRLTRAGLSLAGILAAMLAFPDPGVAARATDARLGQVLDAWVRPLVERGDLSGQLLVARDGTIILERSYGFANRELGVPIRPESRFCVASITKPMTIILALDLIGRGRIGYHDSIARWVPEFPSGDRITIEHLLRHSSGIPHEIVPESLATRPRTAAEMVELAARLPLDFPPGSRSRYSSGGFTVLARILEIASGKDYGTLLEEQVCRPLGMTHTRHASALEVMADRVASYVPGPRGVENAPLADFSRLVGAGSVWSTPRDIHLLAQGVIGGRFGPTVRQALVRGGKLEFSGRVSGFRAYADWDSASGLEVIFAGNYITGAADLVRGAVPRLAAGESVPRPAVPELADRPVPEARLHHCEGDYLLGNGIRLSLRVKDHALWANEWLLLPTRDGAFFSPRDYGLVRPVEGADGTVERLDWTQGGTVYPAPRVAEGE